MASKRSELIESLQIENINLKTENKNLKDDIERMFKAGDFNDSAQEIESLTKLVADHGESLDAYRARVLKDTQQIVDLKESVRLLEKQLSEQAPVINSLQKENSEYATRIQSLNQQYSDIHLECEKLKEALRNLFKLMPDLQFQIMVECLCSDYHRSMSNVGYILSQAIKSARL